MVDDAKRPAESERPLRDDELEQPQTGNSRARNIECGPTDGERPDRPTRSGRGRREKDDEHSGRFRRRDE